MTTANNQAGTLITTPLRYSHSDTNTQHGIKIVLSFMTFAWQNNCRHANNQIPFQVT